MRYPIYPTQPFTGDPPSMWSPANRASDLTYSGSTAPAYQSRIDAAHGRHLAGSDESVQDEQVESGYALNELRVMEAMDDVQGAGVFDSPGVTGPNLHAGAGVFEARFSLPGYLARERMFMASEVRDVTTGRPIVPVPNSPIAFDTNQQVAYIERGLNQPFRPVVSATSRGEMPSESIVNVVQNPEPIAPGAARPVGEFPPGDGKRALLLAGGAAVAAGALWWYFAGPGKRHARNGGSRRGRKR